MYSSEPAPAASNAPSRLRLWPAIAIVAAMWAAIKLPGLVSDDALLKFAGMFWGAVGGAALFVLWWLFLSRAPWRDRWLGLALFAAIGVGMYFLLDPSVGGFGVIFYSLPLAFTAWMLWLIASQRLSRRARLAGLGVVLAAAWGYVATLRFDGVDGDFNSKISFRWETTDEQRFLAERARSKSEPGASAPAAVIALSPGDWPAFRGANRDGRLPGVLIATDWNAEPPKELWRRRVGPGWSSFAVIGNRLFTQEQRGESEVVVCYDADTGNEVWTHADTARFEESVAGPGPRATPTFHDGRIYSMGGAGRLNCLEAATGKLIWRRDVLKDAGAKLQEWGCAASPLIHNGIVAVYAGGPDGKAVIAYKTADGEIAWTGGVGTHSYCSLQLSRLHGVEQLLIATDAGLTAFEPATGKVLWHDDWDTGGQIARIVQPAVIGESDVLLGTAFEKGTRRVHLEVKDGQWSPSHVWETIAFKPYYNDFVIHDDHIYGFNGTFFICMSLADQKIRWKERGYGAGQALLLPDQNLIIVLTEKGEVALVETNPNQRKEIARIPAIQGKTWNHPVIAHGKLFVRNGAEMACFALRSKNANAETK